MYWANSGTSAQNGVMMVVPIGGGMATTLAAAPNAFAVAVNATDLYWTQGLSSSAPGSVMRLPLGGGVPTTLSSTAGMASHARILPRSSTSGPRDAGPVQASPLAGGTPTVLAASFHAPMLGIAVDATSVYFTVLTGGSTGVFKVTPK